MRSAIILLAVSLAAAETGSAQEPALVGGAILTPKVNVRNGPGEPIFQLKIDPGISGYDYGVIYGYTTSGAYITFAAFYPNPYPPASHRPLNVLGYGLSLYDRPGTVSIDEIVIFATDGNIITYNAAQIAALLGSATFTEINNGTSDVTPPQFGTGEILTPTVSLYGTSPYFAARLAVSDDLSGVGYATLQLSRRNQTPLYAESSLEAPVTGGRVIISADLAHTTAQIGTYTITAIQVCDYVGNCANTTARADIVKAFGTIKFKVTR